MKKLFTLMFFISAIIPLSAETADFNVKDAIKEYEKGLRGEVQQLSKNVEVSEPISILKPFVTRVNAYYPAGGEDVIEEEHQTDAYIQRKVVVPGSFVCNEMENGGDPVAGIGVFDGTSIRFLDHAYDNIMFKIKKEGDWEYLSFNLNYDINFTNAQDRSNKRELLRIMGDDAIKGKDLVFTFEYASRYFTLKKFNSTKEYKKYKKETETVSFQYEGKTVTLKVETIPTLIATRKKETVYIVFEPILKNLYQDFEYVRNATAIHQ